MTLLLMLAAFGAGLDFQEQPIPDITVTSTGGIVEETTTNFVHADVNDDRLPDLVFARFVWLQGPAGFRKEDQLPLPEPTAPEQLDTWGGELFIRMAGGLKVLRLAGRDWEQRVDVQVDWPASRSAVTETPTRRLAKFLHDLDADGKPEVAVVSPAGLHLFSIEGGEVRALPVWPLLPSLRLFPSDPQPLWPDARRQLAIPAWHLAARMVLEKHSVLVVSQEQLPGDRVRYEQAAYALSPDEPLNMPPAPVATKSQPMPGHLRPCRLNKDAQIDFAGTQWERPQLGVMTAPMLGIALSLDSGASMQMWRIPVLPQRHAPAYFVDWNGDGLQDLVLLRSHAFEAGARETIARLLTRKAVDETLQIFLQGNDGFPREPTDSRRITLNLGAPPLQSPQDYLSYLRGERVSMRGDFNGDGWRDLALRANDDSIEIFLTESGKISSQASQRLSVFPEEVFAVTDVDGDGRADLVLQPSAGAEPEAESRVFFSRSKS